VKSAKVFWINTTEEELHFIDGIVTAYDGLANVRREYRLREGKRYFKVYVAPGMEDEFMRLMKKLQQVAAILEVLEGENEDPSTT
jgi:hypothetical protein